MPLRKATLSTSTLQDNAASFVNVTAKRLHIRKIDMNFEVGAGTLVAADEATASVDEVPVTQLRVNDSRSHITGCNMTVPSLAGIAITGQTQKVISFNRNDLVLDPDEALFLNLADVGGAPPIDCQVQIWYED